jgi:multidrug efflux pump
VAFTRRVVLGGGLVWRMPSSCLPEEDQGYIDVNVQTPPGTSLERTSATMSHVSQVVRSNPNVAGVMQVTGFSFIGQGENVGLGFVRLKPWEERKETSNDIILWANRTLARTVPEATRAFATNLPTVRGLGQFGGFDMYLEDRAGDGHDALVAAQNALLDKTVDSPILTNVRANTLDDAPQLNLNVDLNQAQAMGLDATDIYTSISLMFAPVYANDFYYQGRVLRVMLQADAPFRTGPESLDRLYVPSKLTTLSSGAGTAALPAMIPLSSVVQPQWIVTPPNLARYNGYSAIEITGANAPGYSSGEAMNEMQRLIRQNLPNGVGFDWAGQSLQEIASGNQAPLLFSLSILVVYLCLAALYESWSVPVSVVLVVPLGMLGALALVQMRGLPNDIYFKIGLVTIIGLAAKNAILIVEFAVAAHSAGKSLRAAVIEAARLRFRPIVMTSFAFILGVMPLVLSSGAGANARHAIGTGVAGGMITAVVLGVLFVPVFYVVVRRLMGDSLDGPGPQSQSAHDSAPPSLPSH